MLQAKLKRARTQEKRRDILEELERPPFPESLGYIWDSYADLRRAKARDAMGNVLPIDFLDLDAFNRLTRMELTPFEVKLLMDLDAIYRRAKSIADAE